jgi:hypothetical protein
MFFVAACACRFASCSCCFSSLIASECHQPLHARFVSIVMWWLKLSLVCNAIAVTAAAAPLAAIFSRHRLLVQHFQTSQMSCRWHRKFAMSRISILHSGLRHDVLLVWVSKLTGCLVDEIANLQFRWLRSCTAGCEMPVHIEPHL